MSQGKFVAYYRVSTAKQGASGLGLEAQQKAVHDFLNGGKSRVVAEFTEVESGKRVDNRPQLTEAFKACRLYGAKLVIAKLDRLSRDAHFLLGLQKSDIPFVAADMPEANEMVVGIMAVIAQGERKMISQRTKAALAAAKARGVKLGGFRGVRLSPEAQKAGPATRQASSKARASQLQPTIAEIRARGVTTLAGIAGELTARGIPTASGKPIWSAVQVSRVVGISEPLHPRVAG